MILGQAAGTAASLAVDSRKPVQDISVSDFSGSCANMARCFIWTRVSSGYHIGMHRSSVNPRWVC